MCRSLIIMTHSTEISIQGTFCFEFDNFQKMLTRTFYLTVLLLHQIARDHALQMCTKTMVNNSDNLSHNSTCRCKTELKQYPDVCIKMISNVVKL